MNKPNSVDRASDHAVVMPWSKRAEELEQSEGPYCDYGAFCEWLESWNERQEPSSQFDTDAVDKTSLYMAFSAACSETAKAAEKVFWDTYGANA